MNKKFDESWNRLQHAINPSLSRSHSTNSTRRTLACTANPSSHRIITSTQPHPLIPKHLLKSLFQSKCDDMDIQVLPDQESRFFALSLQNFKNRAFNLTNANLGEKSAIVIGRILKSHNFAYVDLSRNSLSDRGSFTFFSQIKSNVSLVHVNVSNNEISSDGIVNILQIVIQHPSIISLDIASYEGLKRNQIGEEGAIMIQRLLRENQILQFLYLSGSGLGSYVNIISEGLFGNTNLVVLDLSHNHIEGHHLDLLTNAIANSQLQKLSLADNKISDQGCKHLSNLLSNGFQKCCPLNVLDISSNSITAKGAKKVFLALRFNNIMQDLIIHSNDFSRAFSSYFSDFLVDNCELITLDISNCKIPAGNLNISQGLSKNRRLESLNISNNEVAEGVRLIAEGISTNKSLLKLDLSSCHLKDQDTEYLVKCLKGNHVLQSVSLKNNNLKESAAEGLLELCRSNRNFQNIIIDANPINFKQITGIKHQLRVNRKIARKQLIPKIKSQIEMMKKPLEKHLKTNLEVHYKLKKKILTENKHWENGENVEDVKVNEETLTEQLKSDYLRLKNENLAKSVLLEEILNENIVTPKQKLKNHSSRAINELEIANRKTEIEIEKSEKKSKAK